MRTIDWLRRLDRAANDLFIAIEDVIILGCWRLDAIARALEPGKPLVPAKAPTHDDNVAEPRRNPVEHGRWT
jgi:hypothetical protein